MRLPAVLLCSLACAAGKSINSPPLVVGGGGGPKVGQWARWPSASQTPAPIELKLYDCTAEYAYWEVAWTPDWKAWCCEHEGRGCPSTSTTTATSTTRTSSSTRTSTRTTSTSTRTGTSTRTSTSTATRTATATRSLRSASNATGSLAQVVESILGQSAPCEMVCELHGVVATCAARIRWAEETYFQLSHRPCEAAYDLVRSQCGACGRCTPQAAGCLGADGAGALETADMQFRLAQFEEPTHHHSENEPVQPTPQLAGAAVLVLACAATLSTASLVVSLLRRRQQQQQHLLHQQQQQQLEEAWADDQGVGEMLLGA